MSELTDADVYVMYAVMKVKEPLVDSARPALTDELTGLLDAQAAKGVVTRGLYHVTGFRPDADYFAWWFGPSCEVLQETYTGLLRSALGRASSPVWSAIGIHRAAEFKKGHVPAFIAGKPAKRYVSLYPYDRTNDWYLLPAERRHELLAEHGRMGREYPGITPNTTQTFALSDYEFLLAFECDELGTILDMMRYLRGAEARRYTRVETPFFAGPRVEADALVALLP